MKLLVIGEVLQDVVDILLVLLHPSGISNPWSIDDSDHQISSVSERVSSWHLGCRLTGLENLVVVFTVYDCLLFEIVVCECELGRNQADRFTAFSFGEGRVVDVVDESVDKSGFAHSRFTQQKYVDFFMCRLNK